MLTLKRLIENIGWDTLARANGRRKETEIQKLRTQAEENVDLKRRIQQTEDKLSEMEKTVRETHKASSGKLKGLEVMFVSK